MRRSVKKRNRHLATACAPRAVAPVRAVELLSQQYFFTSPKLAALATEAEILQKVFAVTNLVAAFVCVSSALLSDHEDR